MSIEPSWITHLVVTITLCGLSQGCVAPGGEAEPRQIGVSGQALSTTAFEDVHRNAMPWAGAGCDGRPDGFDRKLWGHEPVGEGTFPVFMYFVGYTADGPMGHRVIAAETAVTRMASKGYVAATVGYTNGVADGLDCPTTAEKAKCAFDENWQDSAINKLCNRAKADCSRGVVVMGHSLGGGVALLAHDYNENVRAVVSIGTAGDACFRAGVRSLPADRLLAILGKVEVFGEGPVQLNELTGLSCPTTSTQCPVASGQPMPTAGWYQVQNNAVADGLAGHCHMLHGNAWIGIGWNDNCASTTLDTNWKNSSQPWALNGLLDWLDRRADADP